ncbi:MAG: T9SS type A sorting domain-containing protein [Ignavibacteriales bacterium]|nr:T9SS type A sorting domain-containing protein [Ignavibacteriales bacterium]
MKKIFSLFLLLAALVINLSVESSAQSNIWATAYYAGWQQGYNNTGYMPAQDVDYSAFTHLIHFALVPRSDGTLDDASNSVTAFNANEVVTRAHAIGKKVIICVGGWATDVSFRGATNSTNRSKFITNIVNLMRARGYDGVDIDWEPLAGSDGPQYVAFITELRAALDAVSPRPLLMAATAWQPSVFALVENKFDQINLMTYDLAGAWPGWITWHNSAVTDGGYRFSSTGAAPPSADGMAKNFIAAGIPAAKLGIGIDFYGYVWNGGTGTSTGGATEPRQSWTTAPSVQANVPYSTIMKNYYQPQYYRWDEAPQAAYLSIDNTGSSSDKFISYDDEKTVAAKIGYAKNKGMGGVIIWELGGGYRADQPLGQKDVLLQVVKQSLGGSIPSVDMTPPTVAITFPAIGATVSGTTTVTANASDNMGVVGVQFKVDGNNLGSEDISSPYAVSLNSVQLSNGSHTISAVARDAAGNTATSSVSVSVLNSSVDTTPPTITWSSPVNGSSVLGTVTLSVSASDNIGVAGVQFKVDGINFGSEVSSAPYSLAWNTTQVANGSHTVSAVARDAAGNTSTSFVTVTVSNSTTPPPSVTSDLIVFDETLKSPWVNASWSATVTFGSTEQAYASTYSIKTAITGAWAALSLHHGNWGSAGISPSGYKSLEFFVYAATSGTSLSIFFENDAGQSFPKVNYGTVSAGQWVAISLPMSQLNPNNQVINRIDIQEVSGSTKTWYVDNLRLVGTVTAPSAPTLASPANGSTGVALNPTLSWNPSANATTYQVQVSSKSDFSTTAVSQSGVTATSLAVNGLSNNTVYYWRVNATNSNGTSAWSSVASFATVPAADTTAPIVTITAPSNGSTVSGTITVSANASDNQKAVGVQFKLDGVNMGAELTAEPFNLSWNTMQIANGSHTLTAIARDSAGNQSSASVTVTVSNIVTPPTPSSDLWVYQDNVNSPWINASWSASITFQSTEQKQTGTSSIEVVQNGWGALRLHSGPWGAQVDVKGTDYAGFEFAVYGGSVGLSLGVYFENDLNQSFPSVKYIYIPVNQWKVLSFPMTQLNPNKQTIHRIVIQDLSGRQRTYYVDNIRFIGSSTTVAANSPATSVGTELAEMPSSFALSQNFPNPFNPTTQIRYALPEDASVTVEVFNALGQSVAVLHSGEQKAGLHHVEFQGTGLATGTYFYRLTAQSLDGQKNLFVETRKMLLAR